MHTPDKKRRKEIKKSIKEKEALLWEKQIVEIEKRIASLSETLELKNYESSDRIHCDAFLRKLEDMAFRKEITFVSGSLNINGNPVEFIQSGTGKKFVFRYTDMYRSGSCSLRIVL